MNAEMIELDRDDSGDVELWHDVEYRHVIVHEEWSHSLHAPGWYVRDEDGEEGPFRTFAEAFNAAELLWAPVGDVTLAPANRLARDIADCRGHDGMQYLTEYLAEHGAVGIDVQALARLVMTQAEGWYA